MSKYAWIFLNLSEWILFCFHIVIPCLLKNVITYFNVFMKLEVIVWRIMRLFSGRDKIWFFLEQLEVFDLFFFRVNISTRFQIALFNWLGTKLISKNVILSPQKAPWTRLKLLRKFETCNTNVKKINLQPAF